MTLDIDYNTIFQVIDSWERLKRIPDYEEVSGTVLFENLFEKCPPTKVLFGIPIDQNPRCDELQKSKIFLQHATYMIQMLDKALNMLGPDIDLLHDILTDLGKKHAKFGVKPEYFSLMGEALHEMLQEMLQDNYTDQDVEAWSVVYNALSTQMCKAMGKELAVINSWKKLKSMDNYQEVAGSILFQKFFATCPEAQSLFGFPLTMDSIIMARSRRFKMHASYFIEMLDQALNMIEKNEMSQNMANLGKMHSLYGVKEEYFPLMGQALLSTLREMLKDHFIAEVEDAWTDVYDNLSLQMINAMKTHKK